MADTTEPVRPKRLRGRKWMAIRQAVLTAEPRCVPCLAMGKASAAQEVDHIIALEDGGSNDIENLQSICISCHVNKTRRNYGVGLDGVPLDPNHPWNK